MAFEGYKVRRVKGTKTETFVIVALNLSWFSLKWRSDVLR